MSHRGYEPPLLFTDLEHLHHERYGVIFLEPIIDGFLKYRGCERTEGFAPLDLRIEDRLHVIATWITYYRSVTKRTWTPLHAPLKPTDHMAVRDCRGNALYKLRLITHLTDHTA